jgi:hypothetical protein
MGKQKWAPFTLRDMEACRQHRAHSASTLVPFNQSSP